MPDVAKAQSYIDVYRSLNFDSPVSLESLLAELKNKLSQEPDNAEIKSCYEQIVSWFEGSTDVYTEYDIPERTIDLLISSLGEKKKQQFKLDISGQSGQQSLVETAIDRLTSYGLAKDLYDKEWFLKNIEDGEILLTKTQLAFMRAGMIQSVYRQAIRPVSEPDCFGVYSEDGEDKLANTRWTRELGDHIVWTTFVENHSDRKKAGLFKEICDLCFKLGARFNDDRSLLCTTEDAALLFEISRLSKEYLKEERFFFDDSEGLVKFTVTEQSFKEDGDLQSEILRTLKDSSQIFPFFDEMREELADWQEWENRYFSSEISTAREGRSGVNSIA